MEEPAPANDLDKSRITLSVAMGALLVILGFASGGAWWASSITGKIDSLTTAMTSMSADRYGAKDAARDTRDRDTIDQQMQRQIDELKQRIIAVEIKK